jgi:glutaredoxin
MSSESVPAIVIYGKPGCHLCDEAMAILETVQRDVPMTITKRDIGGDPDLTARMGESIPVIEIDGQHFCKFRVNEARLRKRLKEVN